MFFETIVVKTSTEGKLTWLHWPTYHNALQRLCLLQLSDISDGHIIFSSDKKYIYSTLVLNAVNIIWCSAPKCLTERCTLLCIACKADLLALIITNGMLVKVK